MSAPLQQFDHFAKYYMSDQEEDKTRSEEKAQQMDHYMTYLSHSQSKDL